MFNIGEIEIKNLKQTGLTKNYLQHKLNEKKGGNIKAVKYSYFGVNIQKGILTLETEKGELNIKFDVKNGWARALEIL